MASAELVTQSTNIIFSIDKTIPGGLGRAGRINTPHGVIKTPAFVPVATQATVKSVPPEYLAQLKAEVILANTYHLYLEPGSELVARAGGFAKFMDWSGPTMTDSGGFQVFSLGAAFEQGLSKITKNIDEKISASPTEPKSSLVKIDNDGVTFRSHRDGSEHRFTPEKSMSIQHDLGADIIFAFDECLSPAATLEYQREALARTHAWADRSLNEHKRLGGGQYLFGIVQGGNERGLREESAKAISEINLARTDGSRGGFDGFGIGGTFQKNDIEGPVSWVNSILSADKPRHLLGIGEPENILAGIAAGADTFDCVLPTRLARHGTLYTKHGKINILNARFRDDLTPPETGCTCPTCTRFSSAYLSHLFRAGEMLAATLAAIHNLYFFINLTATARQAILDGNFMDWKNEFLNNYGKNI